MKLKAVLDNLDGIDESLKAAYTEKDGKFYLNIEGFDDHNEVKGLRNSMILAKDEKKAAETNLAALKSKYAGLPDDFTVEEYNRLKDAGGGNVDQRLQDQRNRLEATHKAEKESLSKERDTYKSRVEKLASENAINTALTEANVTNPAMAKAVRAMFQNQVKVDFENDNAVVTIDSLPVLDKIRAWAGTDEGKYFVTAPGNGGGGSGNNPVGTGSKKYENMSNTELALLEAKDPAAKAEVERRTKIDLKPPR